MAEDNIELVSPKALAHALTPAVSQALYEDRLASMSGPPKILMNSLQHMGLLESSKPGLADEIEESTGLFTRVTDNATLEAGLMNERGQTANLADIYRTMDVRGVLGAYFAKPVVKTISGFLKGRKDYDTDEFIYGIEKEIAEKDIQRRSQRMDDLNYEMGVLNYKKSRVDFEKMLNPPVKKTRRTRQTRQPKVSVSYKEYCCD